MNITFKTDDLLSIQSIMSTKIAGQVDTFLKVIDGDFVSDVITSVMMGNGYGTSVLPELVEKLTAIFAGQDHILSSPEHLEAEALNIIAEVVAKYISDPGIQNILKVEAAFSNRESKSMVFKNYKEANDYLKEHFPKMFPKRTNSIEVPPTLAEAVIEEMQNIGLKNPFDVEFTNVRDDVGRIANKLKFVPVIGSGFSTLVLATRELKGGKVEMLPLVSHFAEPGMSKVYFNWSTGSRKAVLRAMKEQMKEMSPDEIVRVVGELKNEAVTGDAADVKNLTHLLFNFVSIEKDGGDYQYEAKIDTHKFDQLEEWEKESVKHLLQSYHYQPEIAYDFVDVYLHGVPESVQMDLAKQLWEKLYNLLA